MHMPTEKLKPLTEKVTSAERNLELQRHFLVDSTLSSTRKLKPLPIKIISIERNLELQRHFFTDSIPRPRKLKPLPEKKEKVYPELCTHKCRTTLIDTAIHEYKSILTLGQLRAMQNLRCNIWELCENRVIRRLYITLDNVVDDRYEILRGKGKYDLIVHFTPGGKIKFEWKRKTPTHRELDGLRNSSLKFFRFIDWIS